MAFKPIFKERDYNLYLIVEETGIDEERVSDEERINNEETGIDESFSIHLKVGDGNTPPEAVNEFISNKKKIIGNCSYYQIST